MCTLYYIRVVILIERARVSRSDEQTGREKRKNTYRDGLKVIKRGLGTFTKRLKGIGLHNQWAYNKFSYNMFTWLISIMFIRICRTSFCLQFRPREYRLLEYRISIHKFNSNRCSSIVIKRYRQIYRVTLEVYYISMDIV